MVQKCEKQINLSEFVSVRAESSWDQLPEAILCAAFSYRSRKTENLAVAAITASTGQNLCGFCPQQRRGGVLSSGVQIPRPVACFSFWMSLQICLRSQISHSPAFLREESLSSNNAALREKSPAQWWQPSNNFASLWLEGSSCHLISFFA